MKKKILLLSFIAAFMSFMACQNKNASSCNDNGKEKCKSECSHECKGGCSHKCQNTCGSGESKNCCKSMDNPVIKTIMSRRSIRKYKPEPVPRDKMDIILKCGINAPNGMNAQPWEVRVVDNKDFIDGITKLFVESTKNDANASRIIDENFKNMFRNAPTVIFIAGKDGGGQIDCGLMGENMILAAQSMGYGTCCLGGPVAFMKSPAAAEYMKRLDFSKGYVLHYAIAIGTPDEAPDAKTRDASKVRYID